MFEFPEGLYTDVRIEDVFETKISIRLGNLEESRVRTYKAAFVRVYDGKRWYYGSISDLSDIQVEIDNLAGYAKPNMDIASNPVVLRMQNHKGEYLKYAALGVSDVALDSKMAVLEKYGPLMGASPLVRTWRSQYVDALVVKSFYSSKGANLRFDTQATGIAVSFNLADEEKQLSEKFQYAFDRFEALESGEKRFPAFLKECELFLKNATPVEPGKYRVILSPLAAGVFAHESFGHKSEADFMLGDETMKAEWNIGKRVGSEVLSIVDDGNLVGSGYVPFDDEGSKAEATYLIRDGFLRGRLHSCATAASLDEAVTGNARALDFQFEPIVRMTTTYIAPGTKSREELFSEVEEGIFVKTIKHGSGMSTFTIAPSIAYYIHNGSIGEPVSISVISGNVMETLGKIEAVSDKLELLSFVTGGCGKMEQQPLRVGFGGPHVRVKTMDVQ